jgi:hypothetical protein
MKKNFFFVALLSFAFALSSCTKPEQTNQNNVVNQNANATNKAASNQTSQANANTTPPQKTKMQTAPPNPNTKPVAGPGEVKAEKLIGAWRHTADAQEANGERILMRDDWQVSWTFNPDGTGTYKQNVSTIGAKPSNTFKWSIKGNDIIVHLDGKPAAVTYTVFAKSDKEMVWKANIGKGFTVVEKQ